MDLNQICVYVGTKLVHFSQLLWARHVVTEAGRSELHAFISGSEPVGRRPQSSTNKPFSSLEEPNCFLSSSILTLIFVQLGSARSDSGPSYSRRTAPASCSTRQLPYLCPVSIHFLEENAERVRLGGDVPVQQAGRRDGELHPSDAVLRSDAAGLLVRRRAQSVGHDPGVKGGQPEGKKQAGVRGTTARPS